VYDKDKRTSKALQKVWKGTAKKVSLQATS